MDVGEGKHSLIAGGSANCNHCGHQCGGVTKKLKINLPYYRGTHATFGLRPKDAISSRPLRYLLIHIHAVLHLCFHILAIKV